MFLLSKTNFLLILIFSECNRPHSFYVSTGLTLHSKHYFCIHKKNTDFKSYFKNLRSRQNTSHGSTKLALTYNSIFPGLFFLQIEKKYASFINLKRTYEWLVDFGVEPARFNGKLWFLSGRRGGGGGRAMVKVS